jgi:hypothetical protein
MKSISTIFTGLIVAGSFLHAQEARLLNHDFLSTLRKEAARTHPSAVAGKHLAAAAVHDARSIRLWEDPMVGLGFTIADNMMRMEDGDVLIGIEQTLPKPGMFDARRRKAEAMQRAAKENSRTPALAAAAEAARIPQVNPKVRAMMEMAGAANAEARVADRERLPEVSVGIDNSVYASGTDLRSTMVGVKITLPWFNDSSYRADISAAQSRELAATRDVETMRREVAAMVLGATTEAANAAAQARAYSGEIHEKALQTTKTIEASWISSKAPLTDLLDSARTLFSIRLEQRRMIAMQLAALEELQTLVPNR